MNENEILVDAERLRVFVAGLLGAVGVGDEDARTVAEVLVAADLRGHESHGVARLEQFYVRPIQAGGIDPHARTTIVHEAPAALALDAANGLGQPTARRAMDLCIERARTAGLCLATVRRSNHFGIAGYYAMLALPHDMIGLASTNSLALTVPTGGRTVMLGTNPIAFAAPAGRNRPFVLDMATSTVPSGKLEVKARRGEPLPAGWAVDAEGRPATDAVATLLALYGGSPGASSPGGGLMPLGGVEAGHKGYGLAVMVDVLCGLLAGAAAGLGVGHGLATAAPGRPADVGHMVAAINLDAFGGAAAFTQAMDAYVDALHDAPRAPGVERILVAGEPEFASEERRLRDGIPLHPSVAEDLRALGRELGPAAPF